MAVTIPIITEFDGGGISKAMTQFKQLETSGQKAQFAIKKAAVPAGLAIAGLAVALGDAAKGAIEDDAAQQLLASTLKKTTGATDAQIAANETWISKQGNLLGVTDDELRPALAKLSKATGSVTEAQEFATAAMDIAASSGKPLASVTDALTKAAGGNFIALSKLAPEYRQMIKDGAPLDEVMAKIASTTGGAATVAANTAEGQFKRLSVSLAETKETIGAALLPVIEAVLPYLQKMGEWASEHTTVFLVIAGVVGGLALAIVGVNAAMTIWTATTKAFAAVQAAFNAVMAANPVVLFAIAIAALIALAIVAYKNFEGFRDLVDTVFGHMKTAVQVGIDIFDVFKDGVGVVFGGVKKSVQIGIDIFDKLTDIVGTVFGAIKTGIKGGMDAIGTYLSYIMGIYKGIFNGIAKLWNSTFGKLKFSVPDWVPGLGGKGFDVPNIPYLAKGGIVTGPTLAMIGEAGPEAVIPLDKMNGMGGGVTVNITGGLSSSAEIGQAVVNAIRSFNIVNGPARIQVA